MYCVASFLSFLFCLSFFLFFVCLFVGWFGLVRYRVGLVLSVCLSVYLFFLFVRCG